MGLDSIGKTCRQLNKAVRGSTTIAAVTFLASFLNAAHSNEDSATAENASIEVQRTSNSSQPITYHDNARQAAGIWSLEEGNENKVAVSIRLAAEPEGPIPILESKVIKRLNSEGIADSDIVFFYEQTENNWSIFRLSFRGNTTEMYTLHDFAEGIKEFGRDYRSYRYVDEKTNEELRDLLD